MCKKKDICCLPLANLESLGLYRLHLLEIDDKEGDRSSIYYKDNMMIEISVRSYNSCVTKLDLKGKTLISIWFVSEDCFHIQNIEIYGREIYNNVVDFAYSTNLENYQDDRKKNEELFREIVFKNLDLIKSLENDVPREVVENFFGPIYRKIMIKSTRKKVKHKTK